MYILKLTIFNTPSSLSGKENTFPFFLCVSYISFPPRARKSHLNKAGPVAKQQLLSAALSGSERPRNVCPSAIKVCERRSTQIPFIISALYCRTSLVLLNLRGRLRRVGTPQEQVIVTGYCLRKSTFGILFIYSSIVSVWHPYGNAYLFIFWVEQQWGRGQSGLSWWRNPPTLKVPCSGRSHLTSTVGDREIDECHDWAPTFRKMNHS